MRITEPWFQQAVRERLPAQGVLHARTRYPSVSNCAARPHLHSQTNQRRRSMAAPNDGARLMASVLQSLSVALRSFSARGTGTLVGWPLSARAGAPWHWP
jgi:hypothetical protein